MIATLYEEIVRIAEEFLGPAGERFIARQISFHLKKNPSEITKEDIPKISEWVKVSLALLTDDQKQVDDFNTKIMSLVA